MSRSPSKIAAKIAATVVLINLFVLVLAALVLKDSREQHEERAALASQNLAELLRHNIADHFDLVDTLLDAVAAERNRLEARGSASRAALSRFMADAVQGDASLAGLWLLDAQGQPQAGYAHPTRAPGELPSALDMALISGAPEAGLSIVGLAGGGSGAIVVARRLRAADGRWAGTLIASVPPAPLQQMFSALKIGRRGSIALRDEHLHLLLREPADPGRSPSPPFTRALQSDAQAGTYANDGASRDGVARLHSYRKHERHGFIADVGIANEDFLAPWWREVAVLAVAAAGLMLVTGFAGWNLYRTSSQRLRSDQRIERLLEENRRLIDSLFTANEDQRRNLARDLHDELGQWLAAIQVNARVVANYLASCDNAEIVDSTRTIADSALEINHVIRDMVRMLRPPLLDTLGLRASLEDLVSNWRKYQTDTQCQLAVQGDIDHLPENVSISVYRMLQEALANVTKHARASAVTIRIERQSAATAPAQLVISVEDNGVGMAAIEGAWVRPVTGIGLLGIRERATALGGTLAISAARPNGCRLSIVIPVAAATAQEAAA